MNQATWICLLLMLFVLYLAAWYGARVRKIARRRRKKRRDRDMNELVRGCVGRECVISMGGLSGDLEGIVEAVEDNWARVRTKKSVELVNLDYINRIRVKEP